MPVTENVTILFTDLVRSTEIASSVTPDVADKIRRDHFSTLRRAIAQTGGSEVKNTGDGLMVTFPTASAGLACSIAMQQGVYRHNRESRQPLLLRIGLSSGEATLEEGDYWGDSVIEAARCVRALQEDNSGSRSHPADRWSPSPIRLSTPRRAGAQRSTRASLDGRGHVGAAHGGRHRADRYSTAVPVGATTRSRCGWAPRGARSPRICIEAGNRWRRT